MKKVLPILFAACLLGTFQLHAQFVNVVLIADGIFEVPTGVTEITVEAWGGGGGGALSATGAQGGGAGGSYATSTLTVTPGAMIPFTVGVGGAPGVAGTSSTWNGSVVIATGGDAGSGTSGGDFGGGSTGDLFYGGGNGASASGNNGGGGGGSATSSSSGGDGIGTAGGFGTGNGGTGGPANNGSGSNGVFPGGGGGGSAGPGGAGASGSGANGQIIVSYLNPTCASFTLAEGDVIAPLCNGGNDGFVSVVVTGGSAPYSYSWEDEPFSTDSMRTGLGAGTYKVYVEDAGGCQDSLTIFLMEPAALANISIDPTNESCSGANDGQIAISGVTGGVGSYEYSIDDGVTYQPGATFANLAAGSYSVKVRDANGCESDAEVVDIATPACPAMGLLTWTGAADTNWDNPCNWDAFCVPTTDNDVVIPNVTNTPVINGGIAAVAKSVLIQSWAVLTIHAMGSLTINGSTSDGLNNSGTFNNSGVLNVGNVSAIASSGIQNSGMLNNLNGGSITINRSASFGGITNFNSIINAGSIVIGNEALSSQDGIHNSFNASFSNLATGEIETSRSVGNAIWHYGTSFQNFGKITIGSVASAGVTGILNDAVFTNSGASAEIIIIQAGAGFNNRVLGNFSNTACASLITLRNITNAGVFTNAGFILAQTAQAHSNPAGFTNDGIITYPLGNPIPNVTNNEIIVAPVTSQDCDAISPAFELGATVDFHILGVFSDANAMVSAGTFDAPSNTFTPNMPLVGGVYSLFVAIEDSIGGCTRIVSWTLTTECPILSGTIRWEHNNAGVEGAVVGLTGDATDNTLTDNLGAYSFEVSNGDYQITPTKSGGLLNGVTVTDVMIIQEHVTFVNPITDPYKLIAADVNQSNTISTLDALIIAQTILGNSTAEALFLDSWRFVDAGYNFPNPLNPWGFPESISLVGVAADESDLDFVGVKMGDLDGTASPSSLWAEDVQARNNDPMMLQWSVAEQPLLNPGEVLELPFYVGQFEQLLAYQFGLRYEQSHLELLDVVPGTALNLQANNFGSYEPGQLRGLWWHSGTEAAPSLDADMPVFTLRFKVLRRGNRLSDYLYLDETVLRDEVRDASFRRGRVELQFQQAVSVTELDASASAKLYQNVPNPFNGSTVIGFELPEAGEAVLRVFDVNGRELRRVEGYYGVGYHELRFDGLGASGLLYYRLETPNFSAVRSMMVLD